MAARAGERYQPALRAITIRRSTHERDVCGQELRDDVRVERRGSGQVCYPPAVVHEDGPVRARSTSIIRVRGCKRTIRS